MKPKVNPAHIAVYLLILAAIYFIYDMTKLPGDLNKDVCDFAKQEVKGVINGMGGHGIYEWINVTNYKKGFSISIDKTLLKKGFDEDYYYQEGDSLIKKANSKEFTIKRGNNIAVYVLNCSD